MKRSVGPEVSQDLFDEKAAEALSRRERSLPIIANSFLFFLPGIGA
tara:strand:- start:762 stop:899 length:138 start_codon:yes stop_codon:yes gene_type:complete